MFMTLATREDFTEEQVNSGGVVLSLLQSAIEVYAHRGELDEARRILSLFARLEHSTDLQDRGCHLAATATLRRAEGKLEEALAAGAATIEIAEVLTPSFQSVKHGLVDALEAALALGDTVRANELFAFVDGLTPARRPPYLEAHLIRLRARLAGDAGGFDAAARRFRELETPFSLAVTLLEHGEWLAGRGTPAQAEPLLAEAGQIFEQLAATPWLERTTRLASAAREREAVTAGS